MNAAFLPLCNGATLNHYVRRPTAFFAALVALAVFFASVPHDARGGATFSDTFAIINTGSGNYYYKMVGSTTNTALNAATININLLGGTLTLNGGENKVTVTPNDYMKSWNVQSQNYRFYLDGSSAPTFSQFNNFTWSGDTYPTYTWQRNDANINLLSGKDSGTYKLDMSSYGQATFWNGSADQGFPMTDSATYTGTFNLYYGATGTGAQSSAFSGSGTFVKTGSGTYTLDRANTFTGGAYIDAGAVALTAANAATNGLIAIGQEFSGGSDAKLVLDAGDGTTFTNNILVRNTGGNRTIEFNGAAGVSNTIKGNVTNNNGFQATNASGTLIFDGAISGNGGFEKAGNGTVTFTGGSANTHSGANTVSGGTLVFNKSDNTAAIASSITVSSGATLRTDAVNQMNGQMVTVNGTLNLNNKGQQLSLAGGSGGLVQLGNATLTNNNSDTQTFSGKIEGTGNLVKSGNGQLILTNTTSDFSGTTTVNAGLLTINNDRALGAVPDSATAGKIVIGGASLGFNTSMTLDAKRGISLTSANSTLDPFGGATVTYDGIIAGSGTHGLNKAGGGTLILGGENSYTGLTTVSNGVVRAAHANAFGTTAGGVTVVSGAAVELSGSVSIATEALTLAGSGISSGGALRSVSGSNAYTGLITANTAATYLGADNGATLVVSNVNSGTQELWVTGAGTAIVAGGVTNTSGANAAVFVKTNTGTAVLMSSNAWAGDEYIRQGIVVISNNNALGVGGTTFIGAQSGSATATFSLGSGVINSNAINVVGGGTGIRTLDYQSSGTGAQLGSITLSDFANNVNSLAFNVTNNGTLLFGGGLTANASASSTNRLALDGGGTLIVTNNGNVASSSDRYQVRIGNGTLIIGAGTIIARTNTAGIGHALDLGVDLNNAPVNAVSALRASNNITISNSIYVSTTSSQARILGASGADSTATFSGPIGLAGAAIWLDSTNGQTVSVSGAITNISGTGSLIKTNAGLAVLSGANTYVGTTLITNGNLRIANNSALGTSAAGTTVGSGAALELSNNIAVTGEALTLNGTGISSGGALRNIHGNNSSSGAITLASASRINSDTETLTLSGGITGAGLGLTIGGAGNTLISGTGLNTSTSGTLTKDGAGVLTISAAGNYTGGTTLSEGTLRLDHVTAAGSGKITQSSGSSTLQVNTTGTVANTMDLYNVRTMQTVTLSGNKTLFNATYTVDPGTTTTESGNLTGAGGITKAGTGTLIVTGDNSYTGAVAVNEGVLNLNSGTGGAAASAASVSVAGGATLLISQSNQVNNSATVTLSGGTIQRGSGVSETFGALTVTSASTLDFGSGSTGTLRFGNYTPDEVPTLITVLNFSQGNVLRFGNDVGSFLPTGGNLVNSYFSFNNAFTYDSSAFTITAIPEPSTYVAAAGLMAMFLWPVRRRIIKDLKSILGLRPTGRERIEAYRNA